MVNKSPIETALEGYVREVGEATGRFQRQMDEATELLGDLSELSELSELSDLPEANDTDNNDVARRQDAAGRPPRRGPGIFD